MLDICFVRHPGNNTQALGISIFYSWNWCYSSFSPELTHYFSLLGFISPRASAEVWCPFPASGGAGLGQRISHSYTYQIREEWKPNCPLLLFLFSTFSSCLPLPSLHSQRRRRMSLSSCFFIRLCPLLYHCVTIHSCKRGPTLGFFQYILHQFVSVRGSIFVFIVALLALIHPIILPFFFPQLITPSHQGNGKLDFDFYLWMAVPDTRAPSQDINSDKCAFFSDRSIAFM